MRTQDNIPFPTEKQEKTKYMWRDIERRAQKYALPIPKIPVPYPIQNFDLANKVGLVAKNKGWYLEYLREAYKVWVLEVKEAGSEQNLKDTLQNLRKIFMKLLKNLRNKQLIRNIFPILMKLQIMEFLVPLHSV